MTPVNNAGIVVLLTFCLTIPVASWRSGVRAGEQIPESDTVEDASFRQAAVSAEIAGYSLSKVQRWLHEVAIVRIDPETGLLKMRGVWNYHNTAADCYPFLCWAAYATDRTLLDGPLRKLLHAEIERCNHLDRIPAPFDFDKGAKVDEYPMDRLIFGASEYVKDGLIAIVEVTGRDEWFERMKAIEEDLWKHANIETPDGKIPSLEHPQRAVEVDGEQLQALCRLYTMTGEEKFLRWAERLGDRYLKHENFIPVYLRDHGCEIIGGLGLLLAVESQANPAKAQEYASSLRRILDVVLERGTNTDGFMYNRLDGQGDERAGQLSDGWGYNYVAYLDYDMAVGRQQYRPRIERLVGNLGKNPYMTSGVGAAGGDTGADSAEGAIYLLNRQPVPDGLRWVDQMVTRHLTGTHVPLDKAALWGADKWQCNIVRTVIMHALMHTRGIVAQPWRPDLILGASQSPGELAIVIRAGKPWSGKLIFDIPRHRLHMGFQHDWPRMNTLPEWFTVELDRTYTIRNVGKSTETTFTGKQLYNGLPLKLDPDVETRLVVRCCRSAM